MRFRNLSHGASFSLLLAAIVTVSLIGPASGHSDPLNSSRGPTGTPDPSAEPTPTPSPYTGADLRPTPAQAPYDVEKIFHNGCVAYDSATVPRKCVYGDPNGAFTIALVGDSHASMMFPAFQRLARSHHWRLLPIVKINCPFIDLTIHIPRSPDPYEACDEWNENVVQLLNEVQPNLVVAISFRHIVPMDPAESSPEGTGAAIGRMLARVPGQKIVMVDPPWSWTDVPACVTSQPLDQCRIPRRQVLSDGVVIRETAAAKAANGSMLNLTGKICHGFPCRVVTDGMLMFRDSHHLTATFARSLAPMVDAGLQRLLQPTAAPPSEPPTSEPPASVAP